MSIDAQVRPPLLSDDQRWRRVISEFPGFIAFQRMDDSLFRFVAKIDSTKRTVTLTKRADSTWTASLAYRRPAANRLELEGEMGGHRVEMRLQQAELRQYLLVSRGFHWVQEYPFNR